MPRTATRDRIVEQAIQMLSSQGLGKLSMDELADRSSVSRANLYRIFPGKAALLRELVSIYSPIEVISGALEAARDRPPEEVMPELARAIALPVEDHVGLLRVLVTEVAGTGPEAEAVREYGLQRALGPLLEYLTAQMAAGRLRPVHPLVALQMFAGPLLMHMLARPSMEQLLNFQTPVKEVADEIAQGWVRAMRPA